MKDLARWQIVSFISRIIAMALGLIQSFVIIRILSLSEWGVIQIAVSIGGALGIYQNLGLASASTREISSAKDDTQIFKIFVTSAVIRYFVTIPIAFGLFYFSDQIGVLYHTSAIILPLKIYGASLLFQGFQSILVSVISGTKRFRQQFTLQIILAAVSLLFFIPAVYYYRVNGFFYAYFLFNLVNTIILFYLAFKPLVGKLGFPGFTEFKLLLREIFSTSIGLYIIKILYTNWEKLGGNLLGYFSSTEIVAVFAFAVLYSKKILSISDSVTDVNLPVLSEKYVDDLEDFKITFSKNFNKVFSFIIISATLALFWAPDIINLIVGGGKYEQSYILIFPILLAFVIYSVLDITKSSVFVPAKLVKTMIMSFILLVVATLGFYLIGSKYLPQLLTMAWAMAIGSILALIYTIWAVQQKLKFNYFHHEHFLLLLEGFLLGWIGLSSSLWFKTILFIPFSFLFLWALIISQFLTREDIINILLFWKRLLPLNKATQDEQI